MTGPEGDQPHGWWLVRAVDAPHRLEFEDGFADDAGNPNPDMPTTTVVVTLDERPQGGTRTAIRSRFPPVAAMEEMLAMGMEEGMSEAVGQIDALLATEVTA